MAYEKKLSLKDKIYQRDRSSLYKSEPKCALKNSSCSLCKGKGFKLKVLGAFITAELCECVKNCKACFGTTRISDYNSSKFCSEPSPLNVVNIFNQAGLPSRYINSKLTSFNNFTGNGKTVISSIEKWLDKFNLKKSPGFIISGPVGVGKTYILSAIAKELAFKGIEIRFVDFHQLLNAIRAGYSENTSEELLLRPLVNSDVLIIDELGKGRNNDWEQEKLDQLIMRRYNSNKIIVASSNYTFSKSRSSSFFNIDLDNAQGGQKNFNPDVFGTLEERVGKRIFSRLKETSIMKELSGKNYRDLASTPMERDHHEIF